MHEPSAILAFASFGSVWMLLWGGAALAPIVIHLWNRQRYNETAWAAMEYLLAAVRKNSRRVRVEQLILLAVRIMILLLLAVALADPVISAFPNLAHVLADDESTHKVLVIDGSYSMGNRSAGGSRFERACQIARDLVQESTHGDTVSLVLMAAPPRVIIGPPAFGSVEVATAIEELDVTDGGADLRASLESVRQILDQTRNDDTRLRKTSVYFITDLGRTTWQEVTGPDCRSILRAMVDQASMTLIDVGSEDADNMAVTDLRQLDAYATVGRELNFAATVKNLGASRRSSATIEWIADGRRVEGQSVDVEAGEELAIRFTHRFDEPGDHEVEARLGPDSLDVDNHRFLAVSVRQSLRVLCISGKQGAANNVMLALNPEESDRSQIQPQLAMESALLELDLSTYECVFLCNVGRFGRDEIGVLHDYLARGGGLVFFLGDQVQPDSYNSPSDRDGFSNRILPARLWETVSGDQYFFDPRDYGHRIVNVFRGSEDAGLLTTPVWQYFRLQPYENSNANTALWFTNGDPAIVEERLLGGRSILVATAASDESVDRSQTPPLPWTALASWPSFPPLVHEIVSLAVSQRFHDRDVLVGVPIVVPSRSTSELSLTIVHPNGQRQRVLLSVDGESGRWRFPDTAKSGIYRAEYEPSSIPTQLFAVNVDTRESDPRRIHPDDVPDQLNRETPVDNTSAATATAAGSHRPLFRIVLGAMFGLLLTETFLGWRFGNASA